MKFNIGQWVMKPGVTSNNAEQIRDYRLSADKTELFIFTLCHQHTGANLDGPALEIRVTSPQEDMIRVQTVHFKGDRRKYRKYEIDDRRLPLGYAEDENSITVTSGKTSLVIKKTVPCSFTYCYDGRKLTEIGSRYGTAMLSFMDTPEGPVIHVLGADLMDGTPIYDVKPYLPYSDSRPDAKGGFGEKVLGDTLDVVIPEKLLALIPEDKQQALRDILRGDPRPHYHEDDREYGVRFAALNVRFTVKEHVLTVVSVTAE